MKRNIKILIIEDVASDILLIKYELNKAEFKSETKSVETEIEFNNAIENFKPDIILSDYNLPKFSGIKALEITKKRAPEIPFIFVSGVLRESLAVELLKKGAWDYILKDNFIRLIPAVENALIIKEKNEQVKKTQLNLEKSRAKYFDLYEHAPDMFLSFNFNSGKISDCNKTFADKTGYLKSEIIDKPIDRFYMSDNINIIEKEYIPTLIKSGKIENTETKIVKKDGRFLTVIINAKSDYDTEGLITNIHIAVRDISAIRKKETELKETEDRFEMIFDKTSDLILIFDLNNKDFPLLKDANDATKQFVENSNKSYTNKPLNFLLPHIPEEDLTNAVNKVCDGITVREKITFKLSDNESVYFDVIASLIYIENEKYMMVTARNINEQHHAELKLTEQKENFQALYEEYQSQNENLEETIGKLHKSQKELSKQIDIINRSPVVSFSWENKPGWPVNYVSENVEQIFGYTQEELINNKISYEKLIFPEDLPRVTKEVKIGSENRKNFKITHKTYRIITKNNKIKWINDDTIIIRKKGRIINYEGIVTDVTKKVESQHALEASEKKYRSMLDADPDMVIISSKDKKVHYMNPAAVQKFGSVEKGEFCYKKLFGKDEPCEWCAQKEADTNQKIQKEIVSPKDSKPYLATFSKVFENNGESTYMTSYKDISEIKQLQNERLQFLNILEVGLGEVYLLNPDDFSIHYVNAAPVKNSGYSKEVLLKMKLFDLQENETVKTYRKYLNLLETRKKKEVHFETVQIRKDGTTYPVSVYFKLIRQINKKELLVFVNDISERKQKDETIKLLSTAISQSPAEVIITDTEGNIEYINQKFTEITGWSFSEVAGKNPRVLKSGEQSEEFYKEMWDTISSGKVWNGEFHNKKKNGDLFWEDAIINPVKNNKGKITHYIALKEDITEQKQIREKLIQSELHFRMLFENALIGMYVTTPEGEILSANKALIDLLGFSSLDELKKINLENNKQIVTNRDEFKSEMKKKGFIYGLESEWINSDNEIIYVRESARKYLNEKGREVYEGTIENITDVKLAEKKLKEIHQFNKRIIHVGNLGYAIYDINGNCIAANKTHAEILGTDVPELLKQNFRTNKTWKESQLIELADKCIKYGEGTHRIINGKSSYGKNIWIELNFSRIYNGKKPQLLLILKDISSYMTAKRKQLQTKSEYAHLIDSVNVPIFGIDAAGKIYEWNLAIENLTGYNRHEIKRKNFKDIFKTEGNLIFQEFMNGAFSGSGSVNEELDIISKEGQSIRLLLSSTLQINDDEMVSGIICVAQDITKRERYKVDLEKQIEERTQKLIQALKKEKELSELKSQFVSMASHEFRTPLSAIKFAAGFIRKYYDKAEKNKIEEKAYKIETQVNHMTSLLEDVLTIGKIENGKIKFEPKELNLIDELNAIKEDVLIAAKNSHQILFNYSDDDCRMTSDDKILRNIFNNLLTNAIKFSPDANEIFLTLQNFTDKVILEVQDKGIGIKQEELKNIFSPFRRGRNVETIQGTGLGLAIVKESVELLKGTISVDSETGKGTKFTIMLPKYSKAKLNFENN